MHFNTGYAREAIPLVRRFVDAFAHAEVVVFARRRPRASGWSATRFPQLARRSADASLVAAVDGLVPRVLELTELLVDRLGVQDVGAHFPHRVAYHPTCHSLRALALGDRPLSLLRAVGGIDLVPLSGAEQCCGFGGTFAVKNADTSVAILSDKMRAVLDTGAEVVAGRRQLVSDADRRWPSAPARRRPRGARRRDPRV